MARQNYIFLDHSSIPEFLLYDMILVHEFTLQVQILLYGNASDILMYKPMNVLAASTVGCVYTQKKRRKKCNLEESKAITI